jgi:hypothetical protein
MRRLVLFGAAVAAALCLVSSAAGDPGKGSPPGQQQSPPGARQVGAAALRSAHQHRLGHPRVHRPGSPRRLAEGERRELRGVVGLPSDRCACPQMTRGPKLAAAPPSSAPSRRLASARSGASADHPTMASGLIAAFALGLLALLVTVRLGLLQLAPAGTGRHLLRRVPTPRRLPVSNLFATSIAASRGALLLLEQRVATLRHAHGDTGAVYAVALLLGPVAGASIGLYLS